jgi:mRNA interferase MazF
MRRGEIWWADLPPPIGRRPVLILSRDPMPAARREITVAYLTTTFRHTVVEVPLDTSDGVPRPCVVNLDSINTIPKASLRRHLCSLSAGRMAEVK